MIDLLRAETARFFSRPAVAVLLLLAALVTGVVAAKTIWDTRPATSTEVATARAQSDLAVSGQVRAELRQCRRDPGAYLGPDATAATCRQRLAPRTDALLPRRQLSIVRLLDGDGAQVAVVLAAAMVLAGAAYAGADWRTRSIDTQLLFEPRRLRLWTAKALVVTGSAAVVTAVVLAGYWAALWITADARGLPTGDGLLSSIVWHGLRAVALAAAAGLGSYALTMLFRSSVATLALLFAYAAGGEVLINLVPIAGAARWAAGTNLYAWLRDQFSYVDPAVGCRAFSDCDATRVLGQGEAAWFLAVLLVVAVTASVFSFARRDV